MADLFAWFELIHAAEIEERRALRRQRVMRDGTQAFELPEVAFMQLFRLPRHLVLMLVDDLRDALPTAVRLTSLTVETKVLVALRFYAVGSYQRAVGQDMTLRVSQKSVSRCISQVSKAITCKLLNQWVQFPVDQRDQFAIKQRFMERTGMPGVIGALDGTKVLIFAPPMNDERYRENLYVDRRGDHSINVQLICDYDLNILNVNAKFPGATHDSFIWKSSNVRAQLIRDYERGNTNSWLLGDSGYALEPWVMTPILNAADGTPEARYTECHVKTRNPIERCNGVLKQRFRCILKHRTLHYHPRAAALIINACVVLHNICTEYRLPEPDPEEEDDDDDDDDDDPAPPEQNEWLNAGRQTRARLIRQHFAR